MNPLPILRFPEFEGEWQPLKLGKLIQRVSKPVKVEPTQSYQQVGIRSHGKGLFHKAWVDGATLGDKRVFWVVADAFIVNIVFAWEQAIARTSSNEVGMIASHRFPMYLPLNQLSDTRFLLYYLMTSGGKLLLELASPGGAGRNKTLGQKEFENIPIYAPKLPEQFKIGAFVSAIDARIHALQRQQVLLECYKKGIMQRIFDQTTRFKADDDSDFPDWEEKKLEEVAEIIMGQSPNSASYNSELIGLPLIQGNADIVNGKSQPRNWTTEPTKTCNIGDIIFTVRAPVGAVAKSNHYACIGRGVCAIRNKEESEIEFLYQFLLKYQPEWIRLEQGSTFTAVSGSDIKSILIVLPCLAEQKKIAHFLSTIDAKIALCRQQLAHTKAYKNGLLQQLFIPFSESSELTGIIPKKLR